MPRGAFASVLRCMGIHSPQPPPPTGLGVGPELLDWQQAEPPIRGPPSGFPSDSHGVLRWSSLLPLGCLSPGRHLMGIGGDVFDCDGDWEAGLAFYEHGPGAVHETALPFKNRPMSCLPFNGLWGSLISGKHSEPCFPHAQV